MMKKLDAVKLLLGNPEGKDELLQLLIDQTETRLKTLLGNESEVPESLSYIVADVAVRRFNRIGSEGYESHTVEGESISLSAGDFKDYADDIQAWRDAQAEQNVGRIRFL